MSSILAHSAVGAAVYLLANRTSEVGIPWALGAHVFLAVSPDFDYLAMWLLHFEPAPRVTHSLAFCIATSAVVWGLSALVLREMRQRKAAFTLILASASHLLLDLLVGVHAVPVFWPFSAYELMCAIGVLPSAGSLRFGNLILWRNLLIEVGVLAPPLVALVGNSRGTSVSAVVKLTMLTVWLCFLTWSASLSR